MEWNGWDGNTTGDIVLVQEKSILNVMKATPIPKETYSQSPIIPSN